MSLGSGSYVGEYSFPTRFENAKGTNPEELIAAAHAGCFSMALSDILTKAGNPPTSIDTSATVHLNATAEGFAITRIELKTRGVVPGIDQGSFERHAETAKNGCPVSRALSAVSTTLHASLAT
jgi:osmotically inducible protein OsmC